MEYVLMLIPVVFLIVSVLVAIRAVKRGAKTQKAVMLQMISFFCVCIICFAVPVVASAASPVDTDAQPVATTSETAPAGSNDLGFGMGLLAAALVTGLSGIGGGIAVAAAAPAAIAATSEDPKAFGKALIFVALGEGIALYGLLVTILILAKI